MGAVRVAAIQMSSGSDVTRNEADILRLVEQAGDAGAHYALVPEYATYFGPRSGYYEAAKSLEDDFLVRLGEVARRHEMTVHLGSMLEPAPAGRVYNTSVVVGPGGAVTATYRKVHLFDATPPGGAPYLESASIDAGESMSVVALGGLNLGLSVCFDLRFPELYRALALAGAQAFAVPSAFSVLTGPAHWEVLLRARAIENHAYVIAAAQVGTTSEGLSTYGHSMIVDPWGAIIAASEVGRDDVIWAEVDPNEVHRRRTQIDVLALRRPDVYRGDVDVR
jgi:deaminated glutathione amidase